ncbi:MAG: hypothetical protein Q9162_005407 [Coniocarpon cinnabarinum]
MVFSRSPPCLRTLGTQTPSSFGQHTPLGKLAIRTRRPCPFAVTVRHATHGAQGRANGPKNGPGKRLGAKKTGDEYVIPGNIIFKQRGTNWYPGENVGMGRDHTIFALETGYVKYYRNPILHPKRRYIGVVFDRGQKLPSSPTAPRRRKLNMIAVPRKEDEPGSALNENAVGFSDSVQDSHGQIVTSSRTAAPVRRNNDELKMRPDYSYRESNWQIGRAAEKAGVKVREFVPGDRFRAWRKANVRRSKAAERRALVKKKTGKKKAKARAR